MPASSPQAAAGNTVKFKDASVEVVLYDLATDTETVLVTLQARNHYLVSDQVNGDWATYESCRWSREQDDYDCQVTRYRISTGESVELPNPGVQQYAGALSADGTVYLTRQRGRERAENVMDCPHDTMAIRVSVETKARYGLYPSSTLYGDGQAGKRIAQALMEWEV